MRVGLKYCGHCNPLVDTAAVLAEIKQALPEATFVSWEEEKEALLVLCGCPVACASIPPFAGPVVVVGGDALGGRSLKKEELAREVARALRAGVKGEGKVCPRLP